MDRPKLCVLSTVKTYLNVTSEIRSKKSGLFIALIEPYLVVGTQTSARWIRSLMQKSGINIESFKAHSTRRASTPAARSKGLSIEKINESIGWSKKSQLFAKHYNRRIIK